MQPLMANNLAVNDFLSAGLGSFMTVLTATKDKRVFLVWGGGCVNWGNSVCPSANYLIPYTKEPLFKLPTDFSYVKNSTEVPYLVLPWQS